MTKKQMILEYYNILDKAHKQLDPRLKKLLDEHRITAVAVYYIHNKYNWPGTKAIDGIITKAIDSKNYSSYISRVKKSEYKKHLQSMQDSFNETQAFIEKQESLPYEETQKQLLFK